MARPIKPRRICRMPQTVEFSPDNKEQICKVELAVDEYETIRLIDYLGLTQEECAVQMNVARTTVQAIYDCARKKIADILINGKSLLITGGCYDVCGNSKTCCGKDCPEKTCRAMCCKSGEKNCECRHKKTGLLT